MPTGALAIDRLAESGPKLLSTGVNNPIANITMRIEPVITACGSRRSFLHTASRGALDEADTGAFKSGLNGVADGLGRREVNGLSLSD